MADSSARFTQGQPHDRIAGMDQSEQNAPLKDLDMDITFPQKMLSAISGSVLTSLVVTPLDVVSSYPLRKLVISRMHFKIVHSPRSASMHLNGEPPQQPA